MAIPPYVSGQNVVTSLFEKALQLQLLQLNIIPTSPRAGRRFHAENMIITTSDFGVVIFFVW